MSNIDIIKALIASKMTYLIIFHNNNVKFAIYIRVELMYSIIIYKLVEAQLTWPLHVNSLFILILNIPPTILYKLYTQYLDLSTFSEDYLWIM